MSALNSTVVSDVSASMSKLNKDATHQQQYQPLMNQQNNGQSSLDYLYQAISLIETKNNTTNPFFSANNPSNSNNMNAQSNNQVNLINNLNQQLLLTSQKQNADMHSNKQHQMYGTPFILPASRTPAGADQMSHQHFYNPTGHQSQFSVVDCRRYFSNFNCCIKKTSESALDIK